MFKINKLLKEIKGVFKLPVKKYYFGKVKYGCPYFFPRNYVGSIIKLIWVKKSESKDFRKYSRVNKRYFNLFDYPFCFEFGWPIKILDNGLGWKDKFRTPRYEVSPEFHIYFFGLQFMITWVAPKIKGDNRCEDFYWEQVLWYLYYYEEYGSDKPDIKLAEENWGWVDYKTKKSTWEKQYLIK